MGNCGINALLLYRAQDVRNGKPIVFPQFALSSGFQRLMHRCPEVTHQETSFSKWSASSKSQNLTWFNYLIELGVDKTYLGLDKGIQEQSQAVKSDGNWKIHEPTRACHMDPAGGGEAANILKWPIWCYAGWVKFELRVASIWSIFMCLFLPSVPVEHIRSGLTVHC